MVAASSPDEPACGTVVRAFDETSGPAAANDPVDTERWARLARAVLRDEGVGSGELGLRFVDTSAMAELNLAHMGTAGPTDVLAFPIDGGDGGATHDPNRPCCWATLWSVPHTRRGPTATPAASGNPLPTGDAADELALLVVHGVLHVLGYDHAHEAEAAAMQTREQQLLAAHHRQP